MIEIREIDAAHQADINLPNEAFPIYGRLVPALAEGQWSHRIELFPAEDVTEMTFPDEAYDYTDMIGNHAFLGAYDGETCVGLSILEGAWFKYMYLMDLKVCASHRGQGVAAALVDEARKIARAHGYRGLYTIGQDNNLNACKFYLKYGFEIGGFDNRVYRGTPQEGKADILFYIEG